MLRKTQVEKLHNMNKTSTKPNKVLDGFLLLHSCGVKLPHEAIKSRISGENIIDVREEDLVYFRNLTHADFSDNSLNLAWLVNLEGVSEMDLQNNNMG